MNRNTRAKLLNSMLEAAKIMLYLSIFSVWVMVSALIIAVIFSDAFNIVWGLFVFFWIFSSLTILCFMHSSTSEK